jgi:cyclophilin family peptidyl-prolyl cis-trans isomerase
MRKLLLSCLGSSLLFATTATQAVTVEMQTNVGTIAIQLDAAHAPVTVNNFLNYVNSGFYKNVLIHRVIKGFMMQGGGFNKADGLYKTPLAPIVNEANNGLSNLTGTIAMARTNDPNSATSQFFINFANNTGLDYGSSSNPNGYAVFGSVTAETMPVVRKIETFASYGNVPSHGEIPFNPDSGAIFIEKTYTSATVDATKSFTRISFSGVGKIVSTPAGINCGNGGTVCALSQSKGSALSLTTTAATGYYFSGWRGDCSGFRRVINLDTTKGNHNCTAVFSPIGAMSQ